MRQKHKNTLPCFFHNDQVNDENETKTLQIVRQFREEYKRVDEQLTKYPAVGTPAKQRCRRDGTEGGTDQRMADTVSPAQQNCFFCESAKVLKRLVIALVGNCSSNCVG